MIPENLAFYALDAFEYGRSVQIGYTQVRQIGNDWLRSLKAERRIELNPIGRGWHIHQRLPGLPTLYRFAVYGHTGTRSKKFSAKTMDWRSHSCAFWSPRPAFSVKVGQWA